MKIALVNQRYGLEVNGGSEYYTRLIAERLLERHDVTILTTTALDYSTWDNYYNEGIDKVNKIKVKRFKVDKKRNELQFKIITNVLKRVKKHSIFLENLCIDRQGPVSKGLIKYINKNANNYDVFIFVTYLYYHTVKGLCKVADKSILIPTAHDEPYIYFNIYNNVFHTPKAIIFLTEEEKKFVHKRFHNEYIKNDVIGIGIDIPKIKENNFRKKYNINFEFIIYVGRVDQGKGCNDMFENFIRYKENSNNNLKLIVMGKKAMDIPKNENILYLGFVSDIDKFTGIMESKALILPSSNESLSISVLEAMACSKPIIVNGKCEVLKGHCIKSRAGLFYYDYNTFEKRLNFLLENKSIYDIMCKRANKYIKQNYNWNYVVDKFDIILKYVKGNKDEYC